MQTMKAMAILLVLGAATPVHACGNAVLEDVNKAFTKAEKLLEEGKYKEALALAAKNHPREITRRSRSGKAIMSSEEYDKLQEEAEPLAARRTRIMAVARMRLGKEMDQVVADLESLLSTTPDDPYLGARLAEALSHTKDSHERALKILADLETRDLMPDAEGWGTLASLRKAAGDSAGRDRALTRCKEAAKSKGQRKRACR